MKYLFVCKYGLHRSPTAVEVMNKIVEEKGMDIESDYLGIDKIPSREFRLPIQNLGSLLREMPQVRGLVERAKQEVDVANRELNAVTADKVFIMERGMEEAVRAKLGYEGEIVCLDIEDKYKKGSAELVSILRERLESYCLV